MRKPSGEGKPLVWRYARQYEVLYAEAQHHIAGGDYILTWRYPDGTSRAIRLSNLALVYDALHGMEEQLGRDGWLGPVLYAVLLTGTESFCVTTFEMLASQAGSVFITDSSAEQFG